MTVFPCRVHSTASSAVKTSLARRGARRGGQPLRRNRQRLPRLRIEHRREQLRHRFRIHLQDGFLRRDELLVHEIRRDHDRGVARPLAVPRLQHVEPLVLDRELEVLDVPVVLLEPGGDLAKLLVGLRA